MGKKRWILLGLILLMLPLVEAIGIEGPMLGVVVYESGKEINVNYVIYNYQGEADLKISGKLADLATIIPLEEDEKKKYFKMELNFPEEIPETGTYYLSLTATETGGKEGMIGAVTSMTRMIQIEVYSKEKDIKVSLSTPNANEKEIMDFELRVDSWSYQDIDQVSGLINIYDEENKTVASLETEKVKLKSKGSKTFNLKFDNSELKLGDYRAEAIVDYDGRQKKVENYFKIGRLYLNLVNYTKEVVAGEINLFSMMVKSNWNSPIEEVFGVLYVEDEEVLQTPTINLEAWGEAQLEGFWEVNLVPGNYEGEIELHFGKEVEKKEIRVEVKEKELERPEPFFDLTVFFLMSTIILLVIIILILYWKKKDKG